MFFFSFFLFFGGKKTKKNTERDAWGFCPMRVLLGRDGGALALLQQSWRDPNSKTPKQKKRSKTPLVNLVRTPRDGE